MKQIILLGTVSLVFGPLFPVQAAPQTEVMQAAKNLEKAGNYTWKSTWETSRGTSSPTVGKINKDGLMLLTMTRRDTTTHVVVKGDKGAIETQEGWRSFAELESDQDQPSPGRWMARMMRNIKPPAAQAQNLIKNTEGLTLTDGAFAGTLTEAGIKEMFTFRGRSGSVGPNISNGKGTIKFWVKDGTLTKIQYHVQGTMTFNNNDRDIDRTTTIEISEVGSTKLEIPAGAEAKMN